jgi:hypothetical protein
VTIGVQANILAIHDKLVQLLAKTGAGSVSVGTHVLLQGSSGESLHWTDAVLDSFLEQQVRQKFGVVVQRRHIRSTMNGFGPTVGDLSIAICTAIQRQHRPRRNLVS